ncbi:formate dehydrogenase accessory protein FdhE [Maridesulfovibrio hydrothermalis]|uniref:Formate dehydrogenase accessory protein n=1 Tax=Maridesulfovibrio hydrothermalis AM13 = DSM 14728 TaxID=1121451 RepID=L0RIE1_9BACT|nr:formate dehydrogenase accessory protein FdhE [Maridesulfovibrio hydrothermalis]CCO25371.1 Formate dehydrogenase accessory protein [Maridesulfovibrio hydrothermalis AM13 = DSM 14728]
MSFDYSKARRKLDKKISELKDKPFLPEELIALISTVARIQLEAQESAAPVIPDPETLTAPEENLQGHPLLLRDKFPYDYEQACELFKKFSTILKDSHGSIAEATDFISTQLISGDLELKTAFTAYLKGDDTFFSKWGEKTPEAPRTLNFLVQSALTPSVKVVAMELSKHLPTRDPEERTGPANKELDLEISLPPARNHGHCPVCGSIAFIHTLHHKQGFRYANCSFCHTEYRVRRLACGYCDEGDPQKLKFFTVDENPGYKVDVCESCKNYMKTADFREMDKISIPALDDLESLPLDFVAVEEGYKRGTLSVWGF